MSVEYLWQLSILIIYADGTHLFRLQLHNFRRRRRRRSRAFHMRVRGPSSQSQPVCTGPHQIRIDRLRASTLRTSALLILNQPQSRPACLSLTALHAVYCQPHTHTHTPRRCDSPIIARLLTLGDYSIPPHTLRIHKQQVAVRQRALRPHGALSVAPLRAFPSVYKRLRPLNTLDHALLERRQKDCVLIHQQQKSNILALLHLHNGIRFASPQTHEQQHPGAPAVGRH